MENKPFTALFDILQAEEHVETECGLLIEVLHQYTQFMVWIKVFRFGLSQGEEKMETGPEGTWSTAKTMVYYFHVFISE